MGGTMRQLLLVFALALPTCNPSPPCSPGAKTPLVPAAQKSGIAPEKRIAYLEGDEPAKLCDWAMGMVGGYGAAYKCSAGVIRAYKDREHCVAVLKRKSGFGYGGCGATVGDMESCSRSQCVDMCKWFTERSCLNLDLCGGFMLMEAQ
jgi:hypothetical protein